MVKRLTIFLCWGLLIYPFGTWANVLPSNAQKLLQIKKNLQQQTTVIGQLQMQLVNLEKSLGQQNQQYLRAQSEQKELEMQLIKITKGQKSLGKLIGHQQQEGRKLLQGLLLQKLYQRPDQNVLLMQQMLTTSLKEELDKLAKLEMENEKNQQVLAVVQNDWIRLRAQQQKLLVAIEKLEKSRELAISAVLTAENERKQLQGNREQLVALQKQQGKQDVPTMRFSFPIANYRKMEHQNKGLNFDVQGKIPVVATQEGKVIFQGPLSTYGNVVMIDHGQQMRSVLLGDFGPTVIKGTMVQKGETIGHTKDIGNRIGKIYFEIRKNEKIENTILYMDHWSEAKTEKRK